MTRIALALASSCLVTVSHPQPDLWLLAWVALLPLLFGLQGLTIKKGCLLGIIFGIASACGIFFWILQVPGFRFYHMLAGAFFLGLFPAVWAGVVAGISGNTRLLMVLSPAVWVTFDYLRAHLGFLSMPWATLAHTQHANLPLLQISGVVGEYGVTFLIVFVNTALFVTIIKRRLFPVISAGCLVGIVLLFGIDQLSRPSTGSPVRMSTVQPAIWPEEQATEAGVAHTIERLKRLSTEAVRSRPALIVWPETAVLAFMGNTAVYRTIEELSRDLRTPLLIGASERVKFVGSAGKTENGIRSYNAAYFIGPGSSIGEPYRKLRLVPFGEYLPLEGVLNWPAWFVPRGFLTLPGDKDVSFALENEVRLGVLICWENLFSGLVREKVLNGATVLVQLTNDGWFGRSAASLQHNNASALRAVENGTPILVASNCGPSQFFDSHGRIISSAPLFSDDTLAADILPRIGTTFYTRHGDVFAKACAGLFLLSLLVAGIRIFRRACRSYCSLHSLRLLHEQTRSAGTSGRCARN